MVPRAACLQRSISPPGVNQRRAYFSPALTVNAVSDRLFSLADAEHQLVRKPLLQNADGSGIAMENLVGKGINNILVHFQPPSLFGPDKPGTPGNDDECCIDSQAVNCREQALYWTLRRMAEQAAFVENEGADNPC